MFAVWHAGVDRLQVWRTQQKIAKLCWQFWCRYLFK